MLRNLLCNRKKKKGADDDKPWLGHDLHAYLRPLATCIPRRRCHVEARPQHVRAFRCGLVRATHKDGAPRERRAVAVITGLKATNLSGRIATKSANE